VGQFARDLPDGSPVGPGWWYVGGTFVRDTFERNVTATAQILGVDLTWSTGGLGTDGDVTFTIDVAPTGQRFTTSDNRLLIDPLEADVEHTFTVTATRPDGTTVRGPIVKATPKVDPDPLCQDHRVARECRAATRWAVVNPETGLVGNVIVCTPWVCGEDGEWGGRMPTDTPWPNYLLIELTGPGGIGWRYVDGEFIDVRPREDEEREDEEDEGEAPSAPVQPDATEPDATEADASEPDATEPDAEQDQAGGSGSTDDTDTRTDRDPDGDTEATLEERTVPEDEPVLTADDPTADPSDGDALTATFRTSASREGEGSTDEATAGTEEVETEERESSRILTAIRNGMERVAAFVSGLFGG
jgi:hypothetical protein